MVKANWSGSFPNLCCGEWTLEVNGVDVSMFIPSELRHSDMNTYGIYEEWHFENWAEVWESYEEGLGCDEWIEEHEYWLNTITDNVNIKKEIFYAINDKDWRHGSCGGCV